MGPTKASPIHLREIKIFIIFYFGSENPGQKPKAKTDTFIKKCIKYYVINNIPGA